MRRLLFAIVFLLAGFNLFAQQRPVSGTVTVKSSGSPLQGVTVQVGNSSAVTGADGKFSLAASDGSIITFTFTGYKSSSLKVVSGLTEYTVAMEEDPQNLEEVVVVGYTTEKKKDLKGAVTVVKMGDALKENNANIVAALQGRVPGLTISTDGAPGSGVNINLRGLASFNFNTPPLFIIDGVPTYDFNGLSPNDIESFQVLKDAASAAIYGARASSGVIVITTKKGKAQNAKITFDAFYGTRKLRNKLDMLNAQEYGTVLYRGYNNDGINVIPGEAYGSGPAAVIPAFIDAAKTLPSANTDWQNEVFQPANTMAYNLSVSKLADKSNFYFGVNYNKEEGLAKHTFYDRLTARVNTTFKVGKRITLGENLSISYLRGNRENEGRVLEAGFIQLPIIPLKDINGNWGGPSNTYNLGDFRNPLGDLNRYKDNVSKGWRMFGNAFVDVEIVKGLVYHGSIAIDNVASGLKFFENKYVMGRFSSDVNKLTQSENRSTNITITNTLAYNRTFNKHDVQALAGYEWINNESYNLFTQASGFFVENRDYLYLSAASDIIRSGGGGAEYGLIGQFGKVGYTYDSKYLFSASIRRDGSSRFGEANRYGYFPAASAAWRISEESFFSKSSLAKKISDLKFRVSWGQNGNDNIKDYNYATFFGPSIDYANYDIFGNNNISNWNGATGFITSSIGNPLTKWEAVSQTNIGFDLGLFNNSLYITADYYIKKSNDLLYQQQLPGTVGEGTRPFINVGDIENKGIELLVSYKGTASKDLNYNLDFTFTSNKNKVLSVGLDGKDIQYPGPHIIKKGLSIAEFYGYEVDGIFNSQAEVDAHAAQDGKKPGMLRFRDQNKDGKIDADDRIALGSPLAKVQMGLNANVSYKSFDLTVFFDSRLGNKIWDQTKWNLDFLGYVSNHGKNLLNAWTPTNTNTTIPILTNNNASFNKINSSYYISDGSYFRLKNVTLGYSIPKSILNKAHIASLRVYLQADNLFTVTKFKGYDFETLNADLGSLGVTAFGQYPHSKGFSFGLNVGF
ncbi:TonB-dependent receptor [Lacibacter sp. H375]|uniref:SusC/RagA family TonB-linked outer membrane protein n=1 Tax=Lacibacter sp. H375 TaxID=3133424 RepID=UPI0030C5E446